MKRIIFFLFIVLLGALSSQILAQENTAIKTSGGGGFMIGYGNFPISDLKAFIPQGFNVDPHHLILGGTGHGIRGRFVIGGSGFGTSGTEINNDSLKISFGGGLGTFDIGYVIVDKTHFKLYPMIGIGGGSYTISIAEKKNLTAGDITKNPRHEININNGGFVIDVSINLNLIPLFEYDENENSYGGFMTGLKIGYLYTVPSDSWSYKGGDIANGPNFGLHGFYVSLMIGGFGSSSL